MIQEHENNKNAVIVIDVPNERGVWREVVARCITLVRLTIARAAGSRA